LDKPKCVLRIDWATHAAAKYACENWHYSKSVPPGSLVKIGAWEDGKFIGAVIFGHGATYDIGSPYGMNQFECVELVRVALTRHKLPVSKIMAIALRFLKAQSPKLKLVVSYADPSQGHHGGIYQATNWIYQGSIPIRDYLRVNGIVMHSRSLYSKFGTSAVEGLRKKGLKVETVKVPGKHKYLMPLDDKTRCEVQSLHKPYPKRVVSKDNVAPEFHSGEGGATPITALQPAGLTKI